MAFSATNSEALAFSGLHFSIKSNPSKDPQNSILTTVQQVTKSLYFNPVRKGGKIPYFNPVGKGGNFFSGIRDSRDRNPNSFTVEELFFHHYGTKRMPQMETDMLNVNTLPTHTFVLLVSGG